MSSLYELSAEMQEFLAMAEDEELDPVAFADTLEGLQYEIEQKAEGYVHVLRQLEADADALKREEERFRNRRMVVDNSIKRLKNALISAMNATGHKNMDAGLFKLKIAQNGGVKPLQITGDIPEQFIKQIPQADTEAIRKFLDSLDENDHCAWACYGERGTHLSIK